MNQVTDEILDQAISALKAGQEPQEIAQKFPEVSGELFDFLETVAMLESIPVNTPPTPMKHRKYAEPKTVGWKLSHYFNAVKYAAMPVVILVAFIGSQTLVNATEGSLPGETLYSVKRASEKARITLSFNDERSANLKLEFTKKRIEEYKQVVAEGSDPEKKAIALAELSKQSEETFSDVAELAAAKAISKNDSSLLNDLVALNKEQKEALKVDTDNPEVLASNEANDKAIAKLITAVSEQSLLDLPNRIAITGEVSSLINNKITVEDNTFTINEATIIINYSGEALTQEDISGKVAVIGTKENNILTAKKIVVIETAQPADPAEPTPEVKGTQTIQPTTTPKQEPAEPADPAEPTPTENPQPSEFTGGFIVEPADQQYLQ